MRPTPGFNYDTSSVSRSSVCRSLLTLVMTVSLFIHTVYGATVCWRKRSHSHHKCKGTIRGSEISDPASCCANDGAGYTEFTCNGDFECFTERFKLTYGIKGHKCHRCPKGHRRASSPGISGRHLAGRLKSLRSVYRTPTGCQPDTTGHSNQMCFGEGGSFVQYSSAGMVENKAKFNFQIDIRASREDGLIFFAPPQLNPNSFRSKRSRDSHDYMVVYLAGRNITCSVELGSGPGTLTSPSILLNRWVHLEITKDEQVLKMFINGVLVQTSRTQGSFRTLQVAPVTYLGKDVERKSTSQPASVSFEGCLRSLRVDGRTFAPVKEEFIRPCPNPVR